MSNLVIGVDGGGTRTRAQLADTRGHVLGNGEAGGSNPQAHGFTAAQNEILVAIQRAFESAHLETQMVAAACFGISGSDRAEERAQFVTWGEARVAKRVGVVNDAEIILAAGSSDNWGIAVIAGTGSIAWGKARDGRIARAGGWGYRIGDEGSGYDLGRNALRACAQAADGRGAPTRLLDAILAEWNLREPKDLIARVYRSDLKPGDLARLAPIVIHVASQGDEIAQKILDDAGDALAAAVSAVARQLELRDDIPLAMTGGVLIETDMVRARLLATTHARGFHFVPHLVTMPVQGAVHLARQLLA